MLQNNSKYWSRQDLLEQIAREIAIPLRKWFRMPIRDYKGKHDTVRMYCDFGISDLHSFIYPGYVFMQKGFQTNPLRFINTCSKYPFNWASDIICEIQIYAYNRYYRKACLKYPELAFNILEGADHRDLLRDLYKEFNVQTQWKRYDSVKDEWVIDE